MLSTYVNISAIIIFEYTFRLLAGFSEQRDILLGTALETGVKSKRDKTHI